MKRNLKKLIMKAVAPIALTETEREKMHSLLREYAAMRPIRETLVPARVPSGDGWFIYLRRPAGITMAALLFLVLSSSGVAYAAEGTLPGSVFYPVKVDVIEPLRLALAASPQARASLQMAFAERRIEEAAKLAHTGKLSTSTAVGLAANFTRNAKGAVSAAVEESVRNSTATDFLVTGFTDQLTAYEYVLTLLGEHSSSTQAIAHFQGAIQAQIVSISNAEKSNEMIGTTSSQDAAFTKSQPTDSQNALRLQHAADAALSVSAQIIGTALNALGASGSASARDEFVHASALAKQGRALLERHDERGAAQAFRGSLSVTARLDVLTHAAALLKLPVFATTSESSLATTTQPYVSSGSKKDPISPTFSIQRKGDGFPFGL